MCKSIAVSGLWMAVLAMTGCTHLTGSGEKVGSVIKVSSEGQVFKTNEVEIVRGGMSNGSGGFSTTPLYATVNDDAILAQLKDALNKQYEVKVYYRDYFATPLSSDSSSRYIVAVERQAPPATTPTSVALTLDNPIVTVQNGVIIIRNK